MSEDYTYDAPVTDWRKRAQELEAEVSRLRMLNERITHDELMVQQANAELRARLDTVLGYAHYYHSFWGSGRVAIPHAPLTFDEWYEDLPQPADDTDAPLTLAAIDDEDGDL